MPMEAATIYLKEVRKSRGLTQESLAELVGVAKRTIERLERNEGSITADTFEMIIAVLKVPAQHVNYLVTSATATAEDAMRLAREALRDKTEDQISEFAAQIKAEGKVNEALVLIQQLENDPSLLDRLLGYGQSLVDQHRSTTNS